MSYFYKTMRSPLGELKLIANEKALVAIQWNNGGRYRGPLEELIHKPGHPILVDAEKQLSEYLRGKRKAFDIKIEFTGTPFQKSVWQALLSIPFGKTQTYADIARKVGRPSAVRAVGAAIGRNPSPIVAPCHRVIGSNGSMTGFSGGLPTKERLLMLEGHQLR